MMRYLFVLLAFYGSLYAKYDLSITAIFQNEGPYLKEWIEFHKVVGVQHFYLFNNLSTDSYKEVLAPYIKNGEVELFEVPIKTYSGPQFYKLQKEVYLKAIAISKNKTRWLAIIDLDEFLFPVKENSLVKLLDNKYKPYSAIRVNWQIYGTSNVPFIPPGNLMIEKLTMKAAQHKKNNAWKSIVRPKHVVRAGIHSCTLKPGFLQVNANGDVVQPRSKTGCHVNDIRINHYITRDEAYYNKVKLPRLEKRNKNLSKESLIEKKNRLSTEYDPAILKFVPALKKRMDLN